MNRQRAVCLLGLCKSKGKQDSIDDDNGEEEEEEEEEEEQEEVDGSAPRITRARVKKAFRKLALSYVATI